ncbi:DNA mismatch repair endonuclease MutL [Mediterraneibacter sp. NSJ-55]|uniref:DNA mismatch repair protein MutL n=1 Tax=Mediterraneibacter hominis TaxID=2763054 RepID=A0A923LFS2_9FIRM|nr:DNA mismatch repair endonuclease MutL [Mediterraneibacter hominis]MBC5687791.1 DNA mismatch repair endonuclease MutL [Mediterraneibacter hominis]
MPHIQILNQITIDKIAAGEVIERPASIVKELVENAIDAGASLVTIEIKDGGISFIRITDNGSGIERADVRNAFLRHSTSKIQNVEDLAYISSLGFRGEALSSIAAVTQTELITKTKEEMNGTRYVIEGGQEKLLEDTGAPNGTTFLIRQLFYNVPARRKFLKTPMTEAGHIQDLLMHLALSHPEVCFQFINNGQEKLRTSGNGKLKDVIYQIYGRDVAANLLDIDFEKGGIHITGYLGKPVITRGNRNFENFFVNGRYVKSSMISKSVEDAYKDFVMQHKFPFVVLHFHVNGEEVDVNVHPTKMELRFQKQQEVYSAVFEGVHRKLLEPELIQKVALSKTPVSESPFLLRPQTVQEKKEPISEETKTPPVLDEDYFIRKMKERVTAYHQRSSSAEISGREALLNPDVQKERIMESVRQAKEKELQTVRECGDYHTDAEASSGEQKPLSAIKPQQLDLFEENLLKREIKAEYTLIGQVFDTYWLVEFQDNLYIIDQHAAHERVLYERTLKNMKDREFTSQYLSPPIILSLSMQEEALLKENIERFQRIGFEIEPFGGEEYAVRAVPDNLFGIAKKELLLEMLDDLADGLKTEMTPDLIDEKVASMSCKAAVKGNNRLSAQEMDTLIGELLTLDNPYHCPHGRPTIIAMSRRELEKKFKRIV